MYVPQSIKPYIITDESFIAPGYGITKEITKPNRIITWSIREAEGVQTLYYRGVIRQMEKWEIEEVLSADVPDEFQTTLPTMEGAFVDAGMAFLAEVKAKTADKETLVLSILEQLLHPESNPNASILLSQATPIEVAAQVLALDGIHSRIVHGVELSKVAQNCFTNRLAWKCMGKVAGHLTISTRINEGFLKITFPGGEGYLLWSR